MDNNERDQLLARLDERSAAIYTSIDDLKNHIIAVDRKTQVIAKDVEKNSSDINWIKWVGSSAVSGLGALWGVIEWLKK